MAYDDLAKRMGLPTTKEECEAFIKRKEQNIAELKEDLKKPSTDAIKAFQESLIKSDEAELSWARLRLSKIAVMESLLKKRDTKKEGEN